MDVAHRPTEDEVITQVGKAAPTGARRLIKPGLILLTLLLLAGAAFWRAKATRVDPIKYITSTVKRGDLVSTITATGSLRGKNTVSVGAEASGRVKAVHADFNDTVKVGQVLAEIDPSVIEAMLAQSKAQLISAQANVKNADATAKEASLAVVRTRTLSKDGLATAQALEAAVATAERAAAASESARAQVIVARAAVESNRSSLAKTVVRSPIDGVVLSRTVEVGQALVAAMTTPELFTVARDLREMEVTIAIDEADVSRARVGQGATFTVDAWPNKSFPGTLRSIHNVAVTKDNVVTYEALLSISNDDLLLRPGMTATVTIHTDKRKDVLLVPNSALRFTPPVTTSRTVFDDRPANNTDDETPRVWVLREKKPVEVKVTVGLTDGILTEVSGGTLKKGDEVITDAEQLGK